MSLSDEQLLDFNPDRLAAFDYDEAWKRLEEHGDVYRVQLVAARMLAGYRRPRLASNEEPPLGLSLEYMDGWDERMRDVIAHLRQGDFLPGGRWYDDEVEGCLEQLAVSTGSDAARCRAGRLFWTPVRPCRRGTPGPRREGDHARAATWLPPFGGSCDDVRAGLAGIVIE